MYVPEIPFSFHKFVNDVKETYKRLGRVVILAAEGLQDGKGNYITTQTGDFAKDAFGHTQLGGVAEDLEVDHREGSRDQVPLQQARHRAAQRHALRQPHRRQRGLHGRGRRP